MKKIFLSLTAVIILFSSCGNHKNRSTDDDAYWKDTLSIRDSAFIFMTDTTKIDASLMTPANADKSPLVVLYSITDKDFSLGKTDHTGKDTAVSTPYKDIAIGLAQKGIASFRFGIALHQRKEIDGFTAALERINEDLNHAIHVAKTLERIDTTRIYLFSMSNIFISHVIKQHPEIQGFIIASTPSRPLMDGLMDMMQTLAKKDTIWKSALYEMEIKRDNLQKLGTKEFNDSIPLPMDLSKDEWEKLKDYSLAEEMRPLSLPILVLQGKDDISLSSKEFDTWEQTLAGKSNTICKQYEDLTLLFIARTNAENQNISRHVPVYVIKDIAEWINSINNN